MDPEVLRPILQEYFQNVGFGDEILDEMVQYGASNGKEAISQRLQEIFGIPVFVEEVQRAPVELGDDLLEDIVAFFSMFEKPGEINISEQIEKCRLAGVDQFNAELRLHYGMDMTSVEFKKHRAAGFRNNEKFAVRRKSSIDIDMLRIGLQSFFSHLGHDASVGEIPGYVSMATELGMTALNETLQEKYGLSLTAYNFTFS